MTAVAEAEVTAVHAPGSEIAAYTPPGAIEYRAQFVMEPAEARALDDQLRECMRAVLRENVDYGIIPGTDKPSLYKPGAEKLLQWFGFGHTMERTDTERDGDGKRLGVTYRCTVIKGLPGQTVVVASCEGYAGYDEDRYYTNVEDATAKEQANARRYKRDVNPLKCREYRAPWNTLMKMAEKRALVGAAIQGTAASGLFTQDVEDMAPPVPEGPKFSDVAMKAFKALDKPVLEAVGKWYRAKEWADPREWDAEQWCMALQAAGFIAGQRSAQPTKPAEPEPSAYEQALARLMPEDSWTLRIQEITDEEDARIVLADLAESGVTSVKGHLIRDAILTAWPGAGSESEAA